MNPYNPSSVEKKTYKPWPLSWVVWLILAYILFQSVYVWWHWEKELVPFDHEQHEKEDLIGE